VINKEQDMLSTRFGQSGLNVLRIVVGALSVKLTQDAAAYLEALYVR
jgi:hypothetical protein